MQPPDPSALSDTCPSLGHLLVHPLCEPGGFLNATPDPQHIWLAQSCCDPVLDPVLCPGDPEMTPSVFRKLAAQMGGEAQRLTWDAHANGKMSRGPQSSQEETLISCSELLAELELGQPWCCPRPAQYKGCDIGEKIILDFVTKNVATFT